VKSIPVALLDHKATSATTLCLLVKVTLRSGLVLGFTSLDVSVDYNDAPGDTAGDGLVTYDAATGFTPATLDSSSDLSVDNTEMRGLIPHFDLGQITPEMIAAGELDYARWIMYQVNYRDLSMGHEILGSGQTGEMTTDDRLGFVMELRAISQRAKQTVVELDSKDCRATYGSQFEGVSPGGDIFERFPCGKPLTWVEGVVEAVGAEVDRTFTDSSLDADSPSPYVTDYFVPGVVEWRRGDNIGRFNEVEAFASGGVVTLAIPTDYPIRVGDAYRIRQDCTKKWDDADHGCLHHWGSERALHFRGEPHIPVGDEGVLGVPGAGL
jgi:uncharacterized phage protein (TIGR02218 family)